MHIATPALPASGSPLLVRFSIFSVFLRSILTQTRSEPAADGATLRGRDGEDDCARQQRALACGLLRGHPRPEARRVAGRTPPRGQDAPGHRGFVPVRALPAPYRSAWPGDVHPARPALLSVARQRRRAGALWSMASTLRFVHDWVEMMDASASLALGASIGSPNILELHHPSLPSIFPFISVASYILELTM